MGVGSERHAPTVLSPRKRHITHCTDYKYIIPDLNTILFPNFEHKQSRRDMKKEIRLDATQWFIELMISSTYFGAPLCPSSGA